MPCKDATTQLQNAAALVDQWHTAYMDVCTFCPQTVPQTSQQMAPCDTICHKDASCLGECMTHASEASAARGTQTTGP